MLLLCAPAATLLLPALCETTAREQRIAALETQVTEAITQAVPALGQRRDLISMAIGKLTRNRTSYEAWLNHQYQFWTARIPVQSRKAA